MTRKTVLLVGTYDTKQDELNVEFMNMVPLKPYIKALEELCASFKVSHPTMTKM